MYLSLWAYVVVSSISIFRPFSIHTNLVITTERTETIERIVNKKREPAANLKHRELKTYNSQTSLPTLAEYR